MARKSRLPLFIGTLLTLFLADSVTNRQSAYGDLSQKESPRAIREQMDWIQVLSEAHQVPVELILGIMQVESGFDPNAVSPARALGLMQLMPATALGGYGQMFASEPELDFFKRQLLDQPDLNILLGVRHLSVLQRVFADVPNRQRREALIIVSYNAGFGRVKAAFGCQGLDCLRRNANLLGQVAFHERLNTLPKETRNYLVSVQAARKQHTKAA